jgi:hypothetical protein
VNYWDRELTLHRKVCETVQGEWALSKARHFPRVRRLSSPLPMHQWSVALMCRLVGDARLAINALASKQAL